VGPRHEGVERRHQENADQETGEKAADDDLGEGALGVGSDAVRERGGKEAERGDERGHHDRPQPQDGRLFCRLGDAHAVAPQLVRVRDVDHRRLHRDAEEGDEADARRDGERRPGELQRQQAADRRGEDDRDHRDHRELHVRIEHEQQQEDQAERQRQDDLELLARRGVVLVLAAPDELVPGRHRDGLGHLRLRVLHGAGEVAVLDRVLHADVAAIVLGARAGSAGSAVAKSPFFLAALSCCKRDDGAGAGGAVECEHVVMRKRAMTPTTEEDHNFEATLRKGSQTIRGIVCKLWLPRRLTDAVVMRLYPRKRWQGAVEGLRSPFAIEGKIRGFAPGDVTAISASEVWVPIARTRHHSASRSETVVEANPMDLQILQNWPREKRTRRRMKVHTSYLLTPCSPLAPFAIRGMSYTGEITMKNVDDIQFTLTGGAQLRFRNHYRYEEREDGTLTYSDLVATHEHEVRSSDFARVDETTLAQLDDFLALVGFGARYRVACLGIEASSEHGDSFRFFRKNVSVPPAEKWDLNYAVIDRADFHEFLRVAYERFIAHGPDDLLRHALHVVVPREERTAESEFTSLYAGLESIVLWYRRKRALEFIVEDEQAWRTLQDDVRSFLKQHAALQGKETERKERRGMMLRKVGELRRVPFGVALEKFANEYHVKLDDLWPVIESKRGEISLTDIRNRLVHGSALTARQFHALIGAKQHIRWAVERALLAALGWPLERSKVRPDFLARNLTAMIELAQDRQDMKGVVAADDVAAAEA